MDVDVVERDVEEWDSGEKGLTEDYISIYPNDAIGIPQSVHRDYLNSTEKAKLLYSENTEEIGIKPAPSSDGSAYTVTLHTTKVISPASFLRAFDFEVDEATRLPITVDDGIVWADASKLH
jgi:hypothetical protein